MSFGGHFDDGEVERQLQEELRRRQAMQGAAGLQAAGAAAATPTSAAALALRARGAEYAHLGLMGADAAAAAAAASPYYARGPQPGVGHSPYAGYGANFAAAHYNQQAVAAAHTPDAAASSSQHLAARLYEEQKLRQQQQVAQQVAQANYAAAYGHDRAGNPAAVPTYYREHPYAVISAAASQDPYLQHFIREQEAAQLLSAEKSIQSTPSGMDSVVSPHMKSTVTPARKRATGATPKSSAKKTGSLKALKASKLDRVIDGCTIKDGDGNITFYTGCVPLGLDDDKYWLSELQVYLRANFAEAFGATEEDIAAPMHGRNKPIALGQVGIRCMHCKKDNPAERGQQATSYPSLISGIYNSVQQMLRLHLDCCLSMPHEVRSKIESLKLSCSSRGGRKQYWIDSAKRLGLVDTPHGIHFGRDPTGPLPPLSGPSVNSKEGRKKKMEKSIRERDEAKLLAGELPKPPPPVDARPLVFPEDEPLISDYLYLTLEQMAPCRLMEADRVGCYKTRKVGFPGLACKHCVGQAGCGRYFPASEASLSQTTTSQTIMNHVRNCRRCPIEIRENLDIMKRNRVGNGESRKRPGNKPKHGGRKVFFHRLWCRIQGIPFEEGKGETKENRKKTGRKKTTQKRRKKRKQEYSDTESDENESSEGSETESESEPEVKKRKPRKPASKKLAPWHKGCVRLTKGDDPHWLSEMEVFCRSDLIELFTYDEGDSLEGYMGRKKPSPGQVGLRCIFCKSLDKEERPNGCVHFPDSLSAIPTKVHEMVRLHFPTCPSIPDDHKATFKAFRGYDSKMANDDSHQYWVDSARDLGLSNFSPESSSSSSNVGWGMTFRRDPLQPSPADEVDLEVANEETPNWDKNFLVNPSDRGECTDQVLLLLRQVRPCLFKKSDRRAGPGSRGRDRSMGYPGLACMHCANKNTLGRYFPVSSKNLTDNTINSLQSHVSSCSRCPEPIKASLAYFSHRSINQKAELSGSWKRAYFNRIWDRLHTDRQWTAIDKSDDDEEESAEEEESSEEDGSDEETDEEDGDDSDDDSESGAENGGQMSALIKAAAIWLTEQDQSKDKSTRKGRGIPGKRGGSSKSLPTKRQRVGL